MGIGTEEKPDQARRREDEQAREEIRELFARYRRLARHGVVREREERAATSPGLGDEPALPPKPELGALGLAAAIAIDIVATGALIWLAASVDERAILRTGAPRPPTQRARCRRFADPAPPVARHVLRLEVAALLAGALFIAEGESSPLAIILVVVGLLLIGVSRARARIVSGTTP